MGFYGAYKEFDYIKETKDDDIRKALIEVISSIDFREVKPDWNTMEVKFHDYLNGLPPTGPSAIAVKFEGKRRKKKVNG